jgi:hypothetical protein
MVGQSETEPMQIATGGVGVKEGMAFSPLREPLLSGRAEPFKRPAGLPVSR